MSDQFIGEIRIFGCNYAPLDWAACDGQLMPISQNTALFSILGTNYGGDGRQTFGLPDLRSRAVMGPVDGQVNAPQGEATVSLGISEMPNHAHTVYGDNTRSQAAQAAGHLPARFMEANNNAFIATDSTPAPVLTTLSPQAVAPAGSGQPHENRQPFQVMNYCIALQGAWPTRP